MAFVMLIRVKPVTALTVADVVAAPVWQFMNLDSRGELLVRAVEELPVKHLDGCVLGASVLLANGETKTALLGNINATDAFKTKHFLTVALEDGNGWFHLARYHDADRDQHGPGWLAAALGLRVEDVFPLEYDVRHLCSGLEDALAGVIEAEPRELLSRSQLITLAVP